MNADEFLNKLRDIRGDIEAKSSRDKRELADDADRLDKYLTARSELNRIIIDLENQQLQVLLDKLDALAPEFTAAAADLKANLDALNKTVQIVEGVTAVVALAARIAAAA